MNESFLWLSHERAEAIENYVRTYRMENQMSDTDHARNLNPVDGIPMPIVNMSRWLFTLGPLLAQSDDCSRVPQGRPDHRLHGPRRAVVEQVELGAMVFPHGITA